MLTTAELSNIIKEEWAADFYKELRPKLGIAGLIARDYEGVIKNMGDTVNIQQLQSPGRAQILTSDNEAYDDKVPTYTNTQLVVNKSAVYPVVITDWAKYQANPNNQADVRSLIADEIARAMDQQVLDTISAGSSQSGVSSMTKAYFAQASRVLSVLNVPMAGRIAIIDPYYHEDLIQINELLSSDFEASSSVLFDGELKNPLYGFRVFVSNLLSQNESYFFHPSFMQLAIQKEAEYKEIDLEGKTNVPSVRVRAKNLFGIKQFDSNRVYKIYNS
jgi:hypothetical protein